MKKKEISYEKVWLAHTLQGCKAYLRGNFTLASGKQSDTYLDCRLLTLSEHLPAVVAMMAEILDQNGYKPTRIGGMSSGADPIIAGFLMNGWNGCRGFFARKEQKAHGTLRLVEGHLSSEDKVVLVDDVATSGGSLIKAAKDTIQHGGRILCAMTIVDREEGAREALAEMNIPLLSLITLKEIKAVLHPIIVAASGGFDPLHVGHVEYLQKAKELGDKLFVILNSDRFLIEKKGYAFMPWSQRETILRALACVDEVIPCIDEDQSVCKTLEDLKPHIFAKGGDRNVANIPEAEVCNRLGITICDGLGNKIASSSDLVGRMKSKT
jgi:orotate phosphoribosyltransferase